MFRGERRRGPRGEEERGRERETVYLLVEWGRVFVRVATLAASAARLPSVLDSIRTEGGEPASSRAGIERERESKYRESSYVLRYCVSLPVLYSLGTGGETEPC